MDGARATVRSELAAGFDPLFIDSSGRSAIECACIRGANQRSNPLYVYRSTESPAVERHRAAIVEALLDAGVPLTLLGPNNWSIAHYAAYYDRPQILAALFNAAGPEAAALANMVAHNWTPLHFAARGAYSDCVRLLLRAGADVNARCKICGNALEVAICESTEHAQHVNSLPYEASVPGSGERPENHRVYPLLLAAGATIPPDADDAYLRKVRAVGFPAYEKAHRMRLTATFAAKFPRLPVEVAAQVVAFAFHVGYY